MMATYIAIRGWADLHLATCTNLKSVVKQRKQIGEEFKVPFALDNNFREFICV
jgi:hypothetical protein